MIDDASDGIEEYQALFEELCDAILAAGRTPNARVVELHERCAAWCGELADMHRRHADIWR